MINGQNSKWVRKQWKKKLHHLKKYLYFSRPKFVHLHSRRFRLLHTQTGSLPSWLCVTPVQRPNLSQSHLFKGTCDIWATMGIQIFPHGKVVKVCVVAVSRFLSTFGLDKTTIPWRWFSEAVVKNVLKSKTVYLSLARSSWRKPGHTEYLLMFSIERVWIKTYSLLSCNSTNAPSSNQML